MTFPALVLCCLPQAAPLHPDLADLTERWQGALEDFGVPGLALVLVEGDEVVHQVTLGERDPGRDLPVTPDTLFYLASATKPFVAFALVQLAAQGKLELDAPVARYLPRFRLADPEASASITVRDLLCHRPGLQSFPIVLLDAYTGEISEERFYHFLAEVEPAGAVAYSNLHFTLAGRVIEALTGLPWRDYLAQHLFAPAGMTRSTGHATWMYAQEDSALPCQTTPDGFELADVRKSDATMHAAGGLGASIADLARWLRLNLSRGTIDGRELCPAAALEGMFPLQAATGSEQAFGRVDGFGLGWQHGSYRGHLLLQHGGGYVGAAAHVSFLPELGLGLAVVANADAGGQALCQLVASDVYERLLADDQERDVYPALLERRAQERGRRPETAVSAAFEPGPRLVGCEGTYRDEWFGTLVLERDRSGMRARLGDLALALSPAAPNESNQERFTLSAPGAFQGTASFELDGGRVVAVLIDLGDRTGIRFTR